MEKQDNLVLSPAHGIEDQFECFNYLSPLQRSVDIIVIKKRMNMMKIRHREANKTDWLIYCFANQPQKLIFLLRLV